MDAALDQLLSKGVLAGLNLREVADAVGVTPANIYYFFGGRQGLLRAAISREAERLSTPMENVVGVPFGEIRVRMFDEILQLPAMRLTALLALDHDPEYEPIPFLPQHREEWQRQVDAGTLPADIDLEALLLMSASVVMGMSIYSGAVARQLGIDEDEVVERTRTVLHQAISALLSNPPPPA